MKRFFLVVAVFCGVLQLSAQNSNSDWALLEGFHAISSNEIEDYVELLCCREWEGRRAGSQEYLAAAQSVADSFSAWGLQPAYHGSWFQSFEHEYTAVLDGGSLSATFSLPNDSLTKHYRFLDDYIPGSSSAPGSISAEAVWVGFGITAEKLGYDDYADVSVQGKVAVIETGIPVSRQHPEFSTWAKHASSVSKLENAIQHGAAAVIFVDKVANPSLPYYDGLCYAYLAKPAVDELFFGHPFSRKMLIDSIKQDLKPRSKALQHRLSLTANTQYHPERHCCNVLGLLEGTDSLLKHEVIILGAHLDGVGNTGAFFPGALDNASGSVDVLTIARSLAKSKVPLRRSLLFILFGAEETGLRGSTYYVEHPAVDPKNVLYMFNFDMVGNGRGLGLWGGSSFPLVLEHFERANTNYIHRPFQTCEYTDNGGRPVTDGMVFGRAGYRTMAPTTPDRVKPSHYHDVKDTPKLTVMPEIMEDVCKMFYLALVGILNQDKIVNQ